MRQAVVQIGAVLNQPREWEEQQWNISRDCVFDDTMERYGQYSCLIKRLERIHDTAGNTTPTSRTDAVIIQHRLRTGDFLPLDDYTADSRLFQGSDRQDDGIKRHAIPDHLRIEGQPGRLDNIG